MPQILEMKKQGEDLWVRVPNKFLAPRDGPVTLYYQSEVDDIRRRAYEDAIRCIQNLADAGRPDTNGDRG
jgi:hypothetical protein